MERHTFTGQTMTSAAVLVASILASTASWAQGENVYRRGDANRDSAIDIADAIFVLSFLFTGGDRPECPATADANFSGTVDISDGITILTYLFIEDVALPPITAQEADRCDNPPPVVAIRHGSLLEQSHAVSGRVQHFSDRRIVITNFFYDGQGPPDVVIWLYKAGNEDFRGFAISSDIRRQAPYINETIEATIPAEITDDMFNYVAIYCTWFPLNYGFARLFPGP